MADKKPARGDVIVVRYADDLVVGFESRTGAERWKATAHVLRTPTWIHMTTSWKAT
jgi:hypothetical protein